jgi:aspartyl aminopeptidase
MNRGIVLKYNANQKYTSDAESAAYLKSLASSAKVEIQEFTNRSDLKGGSTLGNLSNAQVSFSSCDIGLPQLAMHSANELCGVKDFEAMRKLIAAFYND